MKDQVQHHKKSINDSQFTLPQVAMIWDFYVTRSISGSASQKRKISDYGHSKIPYDDMMRCAGIESDKQYGLLADKMPATLRLLDFVITESGKPQEIDIDTCRVAFLIPYQLVDDEKPQPKSGTSKADALLAHIRNAFAHGNTYFFDNGNVLLEDKDKSNTTAMILIRQQTLLDWINLIDKEQHFYVLRNVCKLCNQIKDKKE